MKIKYIAESSFLETNKIYEVLGLVITNQGLSYLILDEIDKFRLWESDDFEMVNIKTNTSRWNFYNSPKIETNFENWEQQYTIDSFLFFGDRYLCNNPEVILGIYTWEINNIPDLLSIYDKYYLDVFEYDKLGLIICPNNEYDKHFISTLKDDNQYFIFIAKTGNVSDGFIFSECFDNKESLQVYLKEFDIIWLE